MKFLYKQNQLCVYYQNKMVFSHLSFSILYENGKFQCDDHWTVQDNVAFSSNCKVKLLKEKKGFKFQVSLKNQQSPLKRCKELIIQGMYVHNFQKCLMNHYVYANNNMANEMQSTLEVMSLSPGKIIHSVDNIAFIDEKKNQGVFGLITYEKFFNEMWIHHDGSFKIIGHMENHDIQENEEVFSDWIYLGFFKDIAYSGLPTFASIIAKNMNVHLKYLKPPVGYCTWYYYYNQVKQENVYENLNFLLNYKKYPVKYIQIDDGWQINWCNWTNNEKFKDLKQLAKDILKENLKPGLWFAPFASNNESDIYHHHKDWFVKNWDNDEPYGNLSLDFSHPEVRKYFYDLFYKFAHEYGFRYFKLDIITSHLAPGRHYDPSFNTVKNLQEGFKIIRKAIGDEGEILACTCPLAYVSSLCDYMRVSGDVQDDFESLQYIFNSTLKRYYMNQKLFINDADCLIIRNHENEDEECLKNIIRTEDEVLTYISLIAASGGSIMLSDKLKNLTEKQLERIDKIFPNVQYSAIPMDLMESHLVSKLDFKNKYGIHVYILVNWEEKPKKYNLKIKESHVYDFWEDCYQGIFQNEYSCWINPHCCKVLQISPVKDLQVIASNATIRPVIRQKVKDGVLHAHFIKANEKQIIYSKEKLVKTKNLKFIGKNVYELTNQTRAHAYQLKIQK